MQTLLNGDIEEKEMLDEVRIEVKFFSTLKEHGNGAVIKSAEDCDSANQELEGAELLVIQLDPKRLIIYKEKIIYIDSHLFGCGGFFRSDRS